MNDRLLTQEERNEAIDGWDTCGEERIGLCQAQDAKTARIKDAEIAEAVKAERERVHLWVNKCRSHTCEYFGPGCEMVAKAQFIADWKRLNEPCDKHPFKDMRVIGYDSLNHRIYELADFYHRHRIDCLECRAEMEAEAEQYKKEMEK